jgi:diaminopimelate decarboxylase
MLSASFKSSNTQGNQGTKPMALSDVVTLSEQSILPVTATVNTSGHLIIGGVDTVELASKFGTPLWIIDETTIRVAVRECQTGLEHYPDAEITYACKAFLCLAMCHLLKELNISLDVVSGGELYTAQQAGVSASKILLHGNNKGAIEIEAALSYGPVRIVIDNQSELELVGTIARKLDTQANILLRVIPGVEADTHQHIQTGHDSSKFGIPLQELNQTIEYIEKHKSDFNFLGLHVHVGSQSHDLDPFLSAVDIVTNCCLGLKEKYGIEISQLDLGGGLGIAYTDADKTLPMEVWSHEISKRVAEKFKQNALRLPKLILEPGRSIIGRAGITLYRVGHNKTLPDGTRYIAVDGGMADNPRPITYQALYTACLANKMTLPKQTTPISIVGKYCEQGDVIIKESYIAPESRDIIAVLATGAYNFSMSSNYNRTGRPACVLVANGNAEIIVERETNDDLLRQDRVPVRLLG